MKTPSMTTLLLQKTSMPSPQPLELKEPSPLMVTPVASPSLTAYPLGLSAVTAPTEMFLEFSIRTPPSTVPASTPRPAIPACSTLRKRTVALRTAPPSRYTVLPEGTFR